ncbi:DUF6249 domain-containing protein [candidate division KSB1 bacterium]
MEWEPILITLTVFFTIGMIIKWSLEYKLRKAIVEKGEVTENLKHLRHIFHSHEYSGRMSSMKWGLVLIGIGSGLLVGTLLGNEYSDEISAAFMFIYAGIALLLYYFIAGRLEKKQLHHDE